MDFVKLFIESMSQHNILTNEAIIADGVLHRIHINGDKNNTRNAWYVLYLDGLPCGAFGNWKSGISRKWCAKSFDKMSLGERAEQYRKMREAQRIREEEKHKEHLRAADHATLIWNASPPTKASHPYLQRKQIPAFCAREYNNCLVLPITDFDGKIWSTQFIYPDGFKKLLTGGAKKNNFISVNGFSKSLFKIFLVSIQQIVTQPFASSY